jgi:hypothetical protein
VNAHLGIESSGKGMRSRKSELILYQTDGVGESSRRLYQYFQHTRQIMLNLIRFRPDPSPLGFGILDITLPTKHEGSGAEDAEPLSQ